MFVKIRVRLLFLVLRYSVRKGSKAFLKGVPKSANPYAKNTMRCRMWDDAWDYTKSTVEDKL
jgi:hypothetical protein